MKPQPGLYLMFVLALATSALFMLGDACASGRRAPEFINDTWINSAPLRLAELKGKVVLDEFSTFGCYNCQNVELYVKSWHDKFKDLGLVVIGVHSPEFSRERAVKNVRNYVREHDIRYAVAIDNDYKTRRAYQNRYWPAMYLIDKQGVIRYMRIGEGGYDQTKMQIHNLLTEL